MSDVQTDQSDADGSSPSPPADPAVAAFEMLREEVALTRRAVAGLAAERVRIDSPDYSETLGQILQMNTVTATQLKDLGEAPALQWTAANWGRELAAVGETARRADRAALSHAKDTLHEAADHLRGWIASARDARRQNTWLKAIGAVGFMMGAILVLILWAFIGGWFSSATPKDQAPPEQQAAAILGMSEEEAGEHLIKTAAPALWNDLVLGDTIVVTNRAALERCLRLANERHRKSERCTLEVPAVPEMR